jgi:hypothetical protein
MARRGSNSFRRNDGLEVIAGVNGGTKCNVEGED